MNRIELKVDIDIDSIINITMNTICKLQVIIELGTGYYVEKTVPEAKETLDRKVR